MPRKTILIAGASGLVGYAAMKHFVAAGDDVIALSRRTPVDTEGARFISVDLQNRDESRAAIGALSNVTHLVYTALFEKPGVIAGWFEDDQIDTNDAMFRNLLDPLLDAANNLEHVTLLQGTKAYGMRRATPVSARENVDEAHHEPNFYWRQENYMRERQAGARWTFTIQRPQIIYGLSFGSSLNPLPAIAAYASILKHRGEPLHFPGVPTGMVQEAIDADLLARVIAWSIHDPAARNNEIFNVTNGDVYSWRRVWPAIAETMGMEVGEDRQVGFAASAEAWKPEWDAVRAKHKLASPALLDMVGQSFFYLDMLMNFGAVDRADPRPPSLVSTIKLRQAGFGEVMDTSEMFRKWLRVMQTRNMIPKA